MGHQFYPQWGSVCAGFYANKAETPLIYLFNPLASAFKQAVTYLGCAAGPLWIRFESAALNACGSSDYKIHLSHWFCKWINNEYFCRSSIVGYKEELQQINSP